MIFTAHDRRELRARSDARYWRDIVAVLCLKVVGLSLLYFLCFAAADQPTMHGDAVADHLLTASITVSNQTR